MSKEALMVKMEECHDKVERCIDPFVAEFRPAEWESKKMFFEGLIDTAIIALNKLKGELPNRLT